MPEITNEILFGKGSLSIDDANDIANSVNCGPGWIVLDDWLSEVVEGKIECTAIESRLAAIVRGLLMKEG